MISNIQYWNDTSSFDSDDFFSSPVDFISQNGSNQYSTVCDGMINEDVFSSTEVNYSLFLHTTNPPFVRVITNNHRHS
jgi:hypothetical protein